METGKSFERLVDIMKELREKCPWDRKQTFETLRILTIEETFELADAIDEKNANAIKEELGDLLLHIVFYSRLGEEQKAFDIIEVINHLCDKLIRRHPHIYGNVEATDEETVKRNWEQIKMKERKKSVLEGVPHSLPAMVKAFRIQDKASQVGFDWENAAQVWEKMKEEMEEFRQSSEENEKEKMESEFGDLLFSLINYARFIHLDPEAALEKTNKKFLRRFQYMESKAAKSQKRLQDMTLAELDTWWEESKLTEHTYPST